MKLTINQINYEIRETVATGYYFSLFRDKYCFKELTETNIYKNVNYQDMTEKELYDLWYFDEYN